MRVALEKGVEVVSVNDPFIDLEYMVGISFTALLTSLHPVSLMTRRTYRNCRHLAFVSEITEDISVELSVSETYTQWCIYTVSQKTCHHLVTIISLL